MQQQLGNCHLSAENLMEFSSIHNKCFEIIKFILTLESTMECIDLSFTTLGLGFAGGVA